MAPAAKKNSVPPTPNPKPISREELDAKRGGVVCQGPSGATYKVRQVDVAGFALSGHLPPALLEIALGGESKALRALAEADEGLLKEFGAFRRSLIVKTIVEPQITEADLEGDDPLVPITDQDWAFDLAQKNTEDDGLGRRIWGPEVPSSFRVFREQFARAHDGVFCDGDGCTYCDQAVVETTRRFSLPGAV